MKKAGFTLIELLVVVLIIGILAAIAVPQYKVAVQKARLARLIPLVDALYKAEQAYFLANGEYTANLDSLDIELPTKNCTLTTYPTTGRYTCTNLRVGVFDGPTNAQVIIMDDNNTLLLAYVRFFEDDNVFGAKKGGSACFSNDETNRKVCKTLGEGTQLPATSVWKYVYILS